MRFFLTCMKRKYNYIKLGLAIAMMAGVQPLMAQDTTTNSPSTTATPSAQHHHHHMRGGDHAKLTKQERTELRAAFQKAKDDPSVVAAMQDMKEASKALREADRSAMLKADPKLQPLLDKMAAAHKRHKKGEKAWKGKHEKGGMLTSDERAELKTAHEKAKNDPQVQTAKTQFEKTRKVLGDAMRKAAIAADPNVKPILDKLPNDGRMMKMHRRHGDHRKSHRHHKAQSETTPTPTPAASEDSSN